jgi:hypothetical protein
MSMGHLHSGSQQNAASGCLLVFKSAVEKDRFGASAELVAILLHTVPAQAFAQWAAGAALKPQKLSWLSRPFFVRNELRV